MTIEQCYEAKTENADAAIDDAQQGRYAAASPSAQAAILAQDRAWLAARGPVCEAAFHTGGTIDGINVSACLLDESTARLDAVRGIVPPEMTLKSTDNSADPGALSWYTTPEGSRIAELDTQGDQSGGAIIAWIIIGGADGFVVNPSQFSFSDGSFTDRGVVQPPKPRGPPGRNGPAVPVPDRLHAAVRRPGRQRGRGLRLRAGHPGRQLAVTPEPQVGRQTQAASSKQPRRPLDIEA